MRLAAAIVSLAVVACHTSPVVLETGLAGATTLAVDSSSVYWIETGPPISPPNGAQVLLRRAALNGGPPQTIAAGIAGSRDLRLVDGQLYFSGFLDGQIFALPVSGGAPRAVVAPPAGEKLSAWAVQGSDVFTITVDATTYHRGGRELFDQEESIEALAALQGHAWYISGHSEIRLAF